MTRVFTNSLVQYVMASSQQTSMSPASEEEMPLARDPPVESSTKSNTLEPASQSAPTEPTSSDDHNLDLLQANESPATTTETLNPLHKTQVENTISETQTRTPRAVIQNENSAAPRPTVRPDYRPLVRSPLNPASTSPSPHSSKENINLEDGHGSPIASASSESLGRRRSTGNLALAAGSRRSSSSLSAAQQILRQKSMTQVQAEEVARSPPKSMLLRDLGRDYSRYPLSRGSTQSNRPLPSKSPSASSLGGLTATNPFSDSRADLPKYEFPDDGLGTLNPYYGGEKGFILYEHEVEDDDKWHKPENDDDTMFKPKWNEYFNQRRSVSTIGGLVLMLGLLCVLVLVPAVTFARNRSQPNPDYLVIDTGPAWAHVNNRSYPLLKNVRQGLIDPATPASSRNRISIFDGSGLELVFSDEFNDDNRTFYPGDDPYWTAQNIWYGATQDLEWYDPVAVTTGGGTLQLTLSAFLNHNLQYMSGMVNSWNQLCFKGGVLEVSVSLPGPSDTPGLWPGVWTMGNLGRPGYEATTDGVWPYTYNSCDIGITPNQSSPDGMSFLPGQKLSACTCPGADHPNPGTGRGAPEIDVLEAAIEPANHLGVVTQSYQVAPFDIFWRPNSDFLQIPNFETTTMNGYCGGPYQQAVSATTLLNPTWYNATAYQKYAFEYVPGTESTGKISWFVGEDQSFMMDGRAVGPNGNAGPRLVSEEPMAIVLNLGISGSWSLIDWGNLIFPTVMHIDYVRIYQKPGEHTVTCDPPGYPTTDYIANHPEAYQNPNLTLWKDTNYTWPTNTLTGNC